MFAQVVDSLNKATKASVQMQHDMFQKWVKMWPGTVSAGFPWAPVLPVQQAQQMQQKWAETVTDLMQRQKEIVEASLRSGQENMEKAFKLGEAKTPEELRTKTAELWQTCLDSLRATNEAQLREFQAATEQWFQLIAKPVE